MYQPQKKHKANHCGYKQKPSRGQVNALLGMYEGIASVTLHHTKPKAKKVEEKFEPVQLELKFG